MPAIDIPHPLPSAIIPPRSVIEFLIDRDVEEYGDIAAHTHAPAHARGAGG